MTNVISAAEQIHEFLKSNYSIGSEFLSCEFRAALFERGYEFSSGAISGFLDRAINKGVVYVVGVAPNPENNKQVYVYRYTDDTVEWNHKGPSHGSNKGRMTKDFQKKHNPPAMEYDVDKQLKFDQQIFENAMRKTPENSLTKKEIIQIALDTEDNKLHVHPYEPSISERLFALASAVQLLEKRTLKDYSTDDLLEELKTRLK